MWVGLSTVLYTVYGHMYTGSYGLRVYHNPYHKTFSGYLSGTVQGHIQPFYGYSRIDTFLFLRKLLYSDHPTFIGTQVTKAHSVPHYPRSTSQAYIIRHCLNPL